VNVIGHNAPRKQAIAPSVKLADGLGDNFGDARVAHVAMAQPGVEASFGLSQQSSEVLKADSVARGGGPREACSIEGFSLLAKLEDEFFRKRIGEAEGDEVDGLLSFEMRQVAARSSGGSHFVAPPSWRRFCEKARETEMRSS